MRKEFLKGDRGPVLDMVRRATKTPRLTFGQRLKAAFIILLLEAIWSWCLFCVVWYSVIHTEIASQHIMAAITVLFAIMALTTVIVPKMMKRG